MTARGGKVPFGPEAVEQEAERWTTYFFDSYVSKDWLDPAPTLPAPQLTVPIDLDDIRDDVERFGWQVYLLDEAKVPTPALSMPDKGVLISIDVAGITKTHVPTRIRDVDKWYQVANATLEAVADNSAYSLYALDAADAVALARTQTKALLASRFATLALLGWGTEKIPSFPIRVHPTRAGLRVHYSSPISWNPLYFGWSDTAIVTGSLRAGRYRFGVDGPNQPMTPDASLFDIPPTEDAYLMVPP